MNKIDILKVKVNAKSNSYDNLLSLKEILNSALSEAIKKHGIKEKNDDFKFTMNKTGRIWTIKLSQNIVTAFDKIKININKCISFFMKRFFCYVFSEWEHLEYNFTLNQEYESETNTKQEINFLKDIFKYVYEKMSKIIFEFVKNISDVTVTLKTFAKGLNEFCIKTTKLCSEIDNYIKEKCQVTVKERREIIIDN